MAGRVWVAIGEQRVAPGLGYALPERGLLGCVEEVSVIEGRVVQMKSLEGRRGSRHPDWAYNNGSDGNGGPFSQRLCTPAGNDPPPRFRASESPPT